MLLAVIMIFTLLPVTAFAANTDKLIALTFDDGPSAYTKRLLDGLRARNVQCTFFLVGVQAERYPGLVKQMWLDGHEIASHTYDHPYLTKLNNSQIYTQLSKNDALLDKCLGMDFNYMLRPPYGDYNSRVLAAVNTPCLYWSMDTGDWQTDNANTVYKAFLKYARDGSLALLHDSHSSSVDAALMAIDTLKAQGYEFVTVSEMYYRRGITLQPGKIYSNAYPGSNGTADGIAEPVITTETIDGGKTVSIKGDSRGNVYYTRNGEYPTPLNSTLYTGPFTVSGNETIKAVSVLKWNGLRSGVTTKQVVYDPAHTPIMYIDDSGCVNISCRTDNSVIFYTDDGSSPNKNSTKYENAFEAVPGTTYHARAYAPSFDESKASMLTYTHNGAVLVDISVDDWCYKYIDRAISEGLFKGYSGAEFRPNENLTRAMLVAVLYRMQNSPDASELTEPFTDIDEDFWCYDAIVWAANNGIISGYEDGSFQPDNDISRQAMCAIMARYMRFAGKDLSGVEAGVLDKFGDKDDISKSLAADVDLMCALGIIQGHTNGKLCPLDGATRAQAAVMLLRMEDAMSGLPDASDEPGETEETETPGETEMPETPEPTEETT